MHIYRLIKYVLKQYYVTIFKALKYKIITVY